MMLIEQHAFYNCRLLDAICFLANMQPTSINIINADKVKSDCIAVVLDDLTEEWQTALKYGNESRIVTLSEYVKLSICETAANAYAASIIYIEKAASLLKDFCIDKIAVTLDYLVKSMKTSANMHLYDLLKELIDAKEKYTT